MEGDSPPTAISPPATKSPTADCRVASPASRSPPDATEGEVPAALVTEVFPNCAATPALELHQLINLKGPVPAVPEDEFDEPPFDDGTDSAYGDQSIYSDTTSLRSSIMKYREEHGRTYHSYGGRLHHRL